MEAREAFLKKLNDLVTTAKENGNQITIDEVKAFFAESALSEEQTELVFDYLLSQKVVVKGYIKINDAKEEAVLSLTEEEEVYLREYLTDLQAFPKAKEGERESLFADLLDGKDYARNRLAEIYLAEVVDIAKEMYTPPIFLGDLIQEGNMGLLLGLDMIPSVAEAHETIMVHIKQSMQLLIEEQAELSSRDKKMVEKVSALDEAIKSLTEELGRKVTIDELAVYMGVEEDEIEDILKLAGEDTKEEEK